MNNENVGSLLALSESEAALVRFLWDAEEHIASLEQGLASLEAEGANLERAEHLYYAAYRMREGALAAQKNDFAQLARVVENIFEHARRGQLEMTSDLISLLIPCCGALRRMLTAGVGAEARVVEGEETPESEALETEAVG